MKFLVVELGSGYMKDLSESVSDNAMVEWVPRLLPPPSLDLPSDVPPILGMEEAGRRSSTRCSSGMKHRPNYRALNNAGYVLIGDGGHRKVSILLIL